MAANVIAIGMMREAGELTESLAKFRKHHKEVGDALLNISGQGTRTGGPVDKDEDRIPYRHQEFPKMLYHADGREEIVQTDADMKDMLKKGFRRESYPRIPQVEINSPAVEKKALIAQNQQLQGQLTLQQEQIEKLMAAVAKLTNG